MKPSSYTTITTYAVEKMAPDTFFASRKIPFDRIVDLSRAYFVSCDTDPNRQTGSGIREGFQVDPDMLTVSKLRLHMRG